MRIDIVTVFPEMVAGALDHSIVKRARERGLVDVRVVNLRDFTQDRHRTTDDLPYGGGGGMVMRIEPIAHALQTIVTDSRQTALSVVSPQAEKQGILISHGVPSPGQDAADVSAEWEATTSGAENRADAFEARPIGAFGRPRIALTDPRGPRFTQTLARQWAGEQHLVLLCGHYEGVDERVRQHLVTDEISIGDYILTGGELPALIIVDALTRLQSGALGDEQAPDKDTFADDLLEYPHYTRPQTFGGWDAPAVLLSGHHAIIEKWRRWHQLRATRDRRPDLFARLALSPQDVKLLHGEEPTAPADPKATAKPTAPRGEWDERGAGTPPSTQADTDRAPTVQAEAAPAERDSASGEADGGTESAHARHKENQDNGTGTGNDS